MSPGLRAMSMTSQRRTARCIWPLASARRGRRHDGDGPEAVRDAPGVIAVLTADDLPFDYDVSPSNHDEPLLATAACITRASRCFWSSPPRHLAARTRRALGRSTIAETPDPDHRGCHGRQQPVRRRPAHLSKGRPGRRAAKAPHRLSGRSRSAGRSISTLKGKPPLPCPGRRRYAGAFAPPSTRPKSSTRWPMPSANRCMRCGSKPGAWAAGLAARKARATRWPSPALCAALTGKPCKMRYDRDDDMIITGKRHDFRIDYDRWL